MGTVIAIKVCRNLNFELGFIGVTRRWKSNIKKKKEKREFLKPLFLLVFKEHLILRSQLLKVFLHKKILITRILRAGICFGK